MDSLIPVAAASIVSISAAVASFAFARRLGLTAVQREVQEQEHHLVDALKERLAIVEAELKRLEAENEKLERENEELRRRVSRLERAIADREMGA